MSRRGRAILRDAYYFVDERDAVLLHLTQARI